MNKRYFLQKLASVPCLGLGLLASSNPAFAQNSPAAGIEQLREFMSGAKSARGEFEQRVQKAAGGSENTSGSFSFARPGKFRWEVKKPFYQLMVADGQQLFFYDKDLNQVVIRKLTDVLGATPAAILFGSNEFERNFKLSELGKRNEPKMEGDWVEALPVVAGSREAGFDKMSIGFRQSLPVAMEVKDAFGRTSIFQFSGVQKNIVNNEADFRFSIPAGAEVIRQ